MAADKSRYDNFAAVADDYWRSFGPEFVELLLPRIDALFQRYHIAPRALLDLGCGTGTFAIRMARRGIKVTGVDASKEALLLARKKAAAVRARVRWSREDMRRFRLPNQFDVVTSLFNSVNHLLTMKDLHAMFRCVSSCLAPGGVFIFDLNNRSCFEEVWGGTSCVETRRGLIIRKDVLDQKRNRATARLLLFTRQGDAYVRSEDCIEERWFRKSEIKRACHGRGLEILEEIDFNPFPKHLGYSGGIKTLWLTRQPPIS